MTEKLVEGLAVARVGQVITWPTRDGIDMGVVIGDDDKDVLAVMAYDKRLKNDVGTKKWRDPDLTARLMDSVHAKVPDVVLDVHRVPKMYAKLTGKLTSIALQRYTKMASVVLRSASDESVDSATADILETVREQFFSLGESDIPAADASLEEWENWLEKSDSATPDHYLKTCSVESFQSNIRYFFKSKSKEWDGSKDEKLKRAIAASYSALYAACGVKDQGKKMKPREIVGLGQARAK